MENGKWSEGRKPTKTSLTPDMPWKTARSQKSYKTKHNRK